MSIQDYFLIDAILTVIVLLIVIVRCRSAETRWMNELASLRGQIHFDEEAAVNLDRFTREDLLSHSLRIERVNLKLTAIMSHLGLEWKHTPERSGIVATKNPSKKK